jgi:phage terminase large subunit
VLAGINRTKELLKLKKIYIFKSCKETIAEDQNYRREKNNHGIKKEAPIKKDDHLEDAKRYLIMGKLPPASKKKVPGMMSVAEMMTDDIRQYSSPKNEHEIYDTI